jgi:hypothetical protein
MARLVTKKAELRSDEYQAGTMSISCTSWRMITANDLQ